MQIRTRRLFAALLMPLMTLTFFSVLPTSPAGATVTGKVLIAEAESDPTWVTDVQSKLLGTGMFSAVDIRDVATTTPSLADLSPYDAVMVFSDNDFADSTALGNVLADYVDAGGRVVVATFALNDDSIGLSGRISTGGYLPFTAGPQSSDGPFQLVKDQPASPLLAGVASFDGGTSSYRAGVTLAPGSVLVAHWNDAGSTPLLATKVAASGAGVVGLNMFPPSNTVRSDLWNASTDGARLMANALLLPAQQPDGWIRKLHSSFVGDNIYNTTAAGQTVRSRAHRTDVRKFEARVYNDGRHTASCAINGTSSAHGVRVRYFAAGQNVTAALESAAGLSFSASPGAYKAILVKVKIGRHARIGSRKFVKVTSTCTAAIGPTMQDAVKAIVRVR
jgi:hypothetical protein